MVDSTAASFRAQAQLNIRKGGSMLINEARSSALAAQCASDLFGAEAVIDFPSLMVSENFGDFLEKYPGLMALVAMNDAAFKAAVDRGLTALMQSGEALKIYRRWFQSPIPPKGLNLNWPPPQGLLELYRAPSDRPLG